MASTKSPSGVKLRTFVQAGFAGLDSSIDVTAQDAAALKDRESGPQQTLDICNNAHCDWRGQIVRDPAAKLAVPAGSVRHVRFYGNNDNEVNVVYADENDYAITLKSDREHALEDAYPSGSVITSTVFGSRVHVCTRGGRMVNYDGAKFSYNESDSMELLAPAYCCTAQRRLVVAGLLGKPTEVHLTRVDTYDVFPDDEDANEESVLRAAEIDVANLIGTADRVMGVSPFEQNRLAIFTRNKVLVYVIDPDINNWQLDERASINIGTVSHNTIRQAGTNLIFCSERGVHTVQRSRDNGILVYSEVLSRKVDILYRRLLKGVRNKEDISAVWDSETNQYHVFFPYSNKLVKRLTVSVYEDKSAQDSWATGSYLNAYCGDTLGGRFVLGCHGGIYEVYDVEDAGADLAAVTMEVQTPISWHGSMTDDKQADSIFLHASGQAEILLEVLDERNNLLAAFPLDIEDDSDGHFPDNPVSRQYIRKFEARYRGLRTRITSKGKGLLRIMAIGYNVRT